jgi:hypothetical protein
MVKLGINICPNEVTKNIPIIIIIMMMIDYFFAGRGGGGVGGTGVRRERVRKKK